MALPAAVSAQESAPAPDIARPPLPPRPDPVDLRGEWTQYVSAAVAGSGDSSPRYGGRFDGYARIDGEALGLWKGLSFNAQAEFIYGKSTNRIGSYLFLPVNAGLAFPAVDQESFDFSFNVVQRIGKFRIQAGKINLLDAASAIPIVQGGGKEGFMHVGLAAPPGLLASPKILGAIASVQAGRVILNIGAWTPDDWTRQYTSKPLFDDGVNGMISAVLPARIGGLQGYHTLSVFLSSHRVNGAEDYPDVRPPPGSGRLLPTEPGGVHVRYAVQQYLWQDPHNPRRGWGLFGNVGVWSGMPGILDWSMNAGVSGSVPVRARPDDRFGIGYFRYSLAERLVDGLAAALPLADEQGGEIFYTVRVLPSVDLTASGQLVDPVVANAPTAAYLNLRLKVDF